MDLKSYICRGVFEGNGAARRMSYLEQLPLPSYLQYFAKRRSCDRVNPLGDNVCINSLNFEYMETFTKL